MDKKPKYSVQQILNYLKDKLVNKERYELEKDIASDPFLSDAMDGFSMLEINELENDFDTLNNSLQQKIKPSYNINPLFKIAATIALFLTIGSITYFYVFPNLYPEKIAQQHSKTEKQQINEPSTLKEASEITIPVDSVIIKLNTNNAKKQRKTEAKKNTISSGTFTKETITLENTPIASKEARNITSVKKETPKENIASTQTIDNAQMLEKVEDWEAESQLIEKDEFYITEQAIATATAKSQGKIILSENKPEAPSKSLKKLNKRNQAQKASMEAELALEDLNIVTGTILVEHGNKPYPGIHIITYSEQSQTYTDENGNFELTMNEDSIVIINFDNLPPIEYNINKDPLPILLKLKTIEITFPSEFQKHAEAENGIENLKNYILEKKSRRTGNPHPVTIACTINEKGEFISFVIEGSEDDIFANQLIRLLKEGPKWIPAENEGEKVKEEITITVIF
ncbi:MAG: hypothetical protein JEZ09_04495 [Salinivirgaceae bacterium]|nr:hypothetical protein [Salinivirgaceae bacterium]